MKEFDEQYAEMVKRENELEDEQVQRETAKGALIQAIKKHLRENQVRDKDFLVIDEATFSDYCGGFFERANSDHLLEMYDFVGTYSGALGTVWTGVDIKDLQEADHSHLEAFHDDLVLMSDGECLDDTLLYTLLHDAEEEFLSREYADIQDKIWTRFMDALDIEDLDDLPEWVERQDVLGMFWESMERAGVYFEEEEGGNVYIDIDQVLDEGFDPHRIMYNRRQDKKQLWLFPAQLISRYAPFTVYYYGGEKDGYEI